MFFLKFTAKSVEGLFKISFIVYIDIMKYLLMIKHKGKYKCTSLHMHIKEYYTWVFKNDMFKCQDIKHLIIWQFLSKTTIKIKREEAKCQLCWTHVFPAQKVSMGNED